MKIEITYFVKLKDNTLAWLAPQSILPEDVIVKEERPMLLPEENKVLIHKETKEISFGHWICNGDSADNWEEIDKSEIIEEENETAE